MLRGFFNSSADYACSHRLSPSNRTTSAPASATLDLSLRPGTPPSIPIPPYPVYTPLDPSGGVTQPPSHIGQRNLPLVYKQGGYTTTSHIGQRNLPLVYKQGIIPSVFRLPATYRYSYMVEDGSGTLSKTIIFSRYMTL